MLLSRVHGSVFMADWGAIVAKHHDLQDSFSHV